MRYMLVTLLLLAFVAPLARAADKAAAPDFSKYPDTRSFRSYLYDHTSAARHLRQGDLLAVSAFPAGDRFALQYFVSKTGQENDVRDVYNWAMQASRCKQLSLADLKNLHAALDQLPAKSTSPPIERLVIVSFRQSSKWVTRSYDSRALPNSMRRIYDIIGERFESKR